MSQTGLYLILHRKLCHHHVPLEYVKLNLKLTVPARELMVSISILMTREGEMRVQVLSLWGKLECVHERRKKARNPADCYQI